VLLDTVVLIYAVESPERLSNRASVAFAKPLEYSELSAISLAEIAIKASIGKLAISDSTVRQALETLIFASCLIPLNTRSVFLICRATTATPLTARSLPRQWREDSGGESRSEVQSLSGLRIVW